MRHLFNIGVCIIAAGSLVGCVTTPKNDIQSIAKVRTVVVYCCDFKDEAPVLPESNAAAVLGFAGAFTGGALGAVAAGVVQSGVSDFRSSGFYKAAGRDAYKPQQDFLRTLTQTLEASGVAVTVRFPSFFDRYNNRYQYDDTAIGADAVLEVRHIAAMAHTSDRYYPTIGASYRLLAKDRRVLTDGVVGSSDPGQVLSWAEVHPFGSLALSAIQRQHRSTRTKPHLLPLTSAQIVVGDSDKFHANASSMYQALLDINDSVAKRVAKETLIKTE